MDRASSADGLPFSLAIAVRPWIGVIATATLGMDEEVRVAAANACTSLRQRVTFTPPIETALADASFASDALAVALNEKGAVPSKARTEALAALEALITWLQGAKPSERAMLLGLGW